MTFRTKLLLVTSVTLAGAVALVTGAVSVAARQAFERTDSQRRSEFLKQLEQGLDQRAIDIDRQVKQIAASRILERMSSEVSEYEQAQREASNQNLDFLDILRPDLTIISSAHWPARFGYRNDWPINFGDWSASSQSTSALLTRIPQPEGDPVPALVAIAELPDHRGYIAGGRRITPETLRNLGQAPGLHTLLWLPPGQVIDANGGAPDSTKVSSLISEARRSSLRVEGLVQWTSAQSTAEALLALPLETRGQVTGVLLAGTSLTPLFALENEILWIGVLVGGAGILIGVLLGWWTTERVTRPVARLADGVRIVASGDWSTRVDVVSKDEIGELATAFNVMTEQLVEQRERSIQAERVAAWRELARRLAHELKNPLFPLQITIENLRKARKLSESEFTEIFDESTKTLLDEVSNLKAIVGRFSDFAKMPTPRFEKIELNELVRSAVKLYEPQFRRTEHAVVSAGLDLAPAPLRLLADGEQLRRVIGNLILNALDAMPEGGTLRIATATESDHVRLSISDTGKGLTEEECARLFTPYYTTKQHGTGLGLAIVQSVVSDHRGTVSVVSSPGQGATFIIDLPTAQGEAH